MPKLENFCCGRAGLAILVSINAFLILREMWQTETARVYILEPTARIHSYFRATPSYPAYVPKPSNSTLGLELHIVSPFYYNDSKSARGRSDLPRRRLCSALTMQHNMNPFFDISDVLYWNFYVTHDKSFFSRPSGSSGVQRMDHIQKLFLLQDYLLFLDRMHSRAPPDTSQTWQNSLDLDKVVIIFSDAYDVFYLRNRDEILSAFESFLMSNYELNKNRVLFNGEYGRWHMSHLKFADKTEKLRLLRYEQFGTLVDRNFNHSDTLRFAHLSESQLHLVQEMSQNHPKAADMKLALFLNSGAMIGTYAAMRSFADAAVTAYRSDDEVVGAAFSDQALYQLLYLTEPIETKHAIGGKNMAVDAANKIFQCMESDMDFVSNGVHEKPGRIVASLKEMHMEGNEVNEVNGVNGVHGMSAGEKESQSHRLELYNTWTESNISVVHFNGWKQSKLDSKLVDPFLKKTGVNLMQHVPRQWAEQTMLRLGKERMPFKRMCPEWVE